MLIDISYVSHNLCLGAVSGILGGFTIWFLGWSSSQIVHFFKAISR